MGGSGRGDGGRGVSFGGGLGRGFQCDMKVRK
jgi:hypothetical protein